MNIELLDALRSRHNHEMQVKAVSGIASDRLNAAAHAPMANRLAVVNFPNSVTVSCDPLRATVILVEFINLEFIATSRVHTGLALGPTVRRTRWNGATIGLAGLQRRSVALPAFQPKQHAWRAALAASALLRPACYLSAYHYPDDLQHDPTFDDNFA